MSNIRPSDLPIEETDLIGFVHTDRGIDGSAKFNLANVSSALNLDGMATQAPSNVAITGGTITGITDLAVADGGTGASTLTGYVQGTGTAALTASATIPNTDITGLGTMSTQAASTVAITGGAIDGATIGATTPNTGAFTSLAASGTVTGSNLSGTNTGDQTITLTGGVTGSGTGSFAATVVTNANLTGAITSVGNTTSLGSFSSANLAGALTDETGSGAAVFATSPTLVTPTLGAATATSINSVTVTGTSTPALAVTGTTAISGTNTGDQTTITGNAGTATILETARLINGVSFNGSADVTVAAAAGTLTGATLAAGVTASSLTSLGTIASLTASTADINGGTIDGTTIGATTPSTGAFTTLRATQSSAFGDFGAGAAVVIQNTNAGSFNASEFRALDSGGNVAGGLSIRNTAHGVSGSSDATIFIKNAGTLVAPASFSSTGLAVTGALTASTGVFTTLSDAIGDVRLIPQNSQSADYTSVIGDAGKHLLHPSADTTARTFTIPANSSVAYPIGTAITFVNQASAGVLTIAITTDTMRLAGAGTTGSRTLAANGIATCLKVTSTEWIISGTGLT